jgi:hypothetical protein
LEQEQPKPNILKVMGNYVPVPPTNQEYLSLVFSLASFSVQQRWKNNRLSAGFMADYFSNFFPGTETNVESLSAKDEVRSVVKYIANELLENAVKFHFNPNNKIIITLYLEKEQLIFMAHNSINPANYETFQAHIQYLCANDPAELYFQQIERNAADEHGEGSGLGLLTMMHDYGATLGWRFEGDETDITVVTQVLVSLPKLLEIQPVAQS